MPRLIDADAFFNDFPEMRDYEWASQEYEVDAISVIRCKDCKNYGTDGNRLNCIVFCCSMPENGFCSMGERRESANAHNTFQHVESVGERKENA